MLSMAVMTYFAISTGKAHLEIIQNYNMMVDLEVISECDTLTITGYSIQDKSFSLNNGSVISQDYAVHNIHLTNK